MERSRILRLVADLGRKETEAMSKEIVSPYVPGSRVVTRVDGLVMTFTHRASSAGWGVFHPIEVGKAALARPAELWEINGYARLLKTTRAVLLWKSELPHAWWGLQLGASEPVLVLIPGTYAQRFNAVRCTVSGQLWCIDDLTMFKLSIADELREAFEAGERNPRVSGATPTHYTAYQYALLRDAHLTAEKMKLSVEGTIRHALARADATFRSLREVRNEAGEVESLVVEWSGANGEQRYVSRIDPRLNVTASGVCLAGRDRDFDMTSLVSVMDNRHGRGVNYGGVLRAGQDAGNVTPEPDPYHRNYDDEYDD